MPTPSPGPSAPASSAGEGHGLHIPDFGIAGALDWLNEHLGGIVVVFVLLYLVVILVKLMRGDDVEFLGLFKSSRRLQETRRALSEMTLLLRGRAIMFKSIESTLRRRSQMNAGTTQTTPDQALQYLCDWIPRGMSFGRTADAQKITLWVPDGQGNLVVRKSAGPSPESVPHMQYEIDPADESNDTFAAKAFRYKIPFVSGDVQNDPRYTSIKNNLPSHPYKSLLAVPVFRGNDVIGALTLDSIHEDAFGEDEVAFAQLFSWLFAEFI